MSREHARHADLVLGAVSSSRSAATSWIAASWCRSALRHGLDPAGRSCTDRLDAASLNILREEHAPLLSAAVPVLEQTFQAIGKSGCGAILSDAQGVVLESRIFSGDITDFAAAGLVEGAHWGEAEEGTNGIGTCLFEGKPVVIYRDQHFASRNIGISCMDAPIYDPRGKLIAALDASIFRSDHGRAMVEMVATLVRDAARRIERDYFCRHFAGARIVFIADDPTHGTALLAVDCDDLVIGASRAARLRLGLSDAMLAQPHSVAQLLGSQEVQSFEDGDRTVLRQALAQSGGNASQAARLLGIGRATLYRRMARAGLRN